MLKRDESENVTLVKITVIEIEDSTRYSVLYKMILLDLSYEITKEVNEKINKKALY